ncbi:MAG: cation acetate symporter [Capsulimonadales bacterium]|nr:cation acetate symporter [Capsulimonadales bacterium]
MEFIPLLFVFAVIVATVGLGMAATAKAKSASDFFVAGRQVSVFMNASAISGEYLSAASFMGVAGLVMKHGYDALWYPVGYAVGYLFLLLFIAGPLRRFGAYTIPDFAEGRFDSPLFRKIAVSYVVAIGLFYTMPQMKGAGVTMNTILGWPYWVGIVVVGGVITFNVAVGGMKGITLVQAFQYWMKAFAIAAPVFILMAVFGGYDSNLDRLAAQPKDAPTFAGDITLKYPGKDKAPSNVLSVSPIGETRLTFPKGGEIERITTVRKPEAGEDPAIFSPDLPDRGRIDEGTVVSLTSIPVTKGGMPVEKGGNPVTTAPRIEFAAPTEVAFRQGDRIPNAQNNGKWIEPYGTLTSKYGYPLLYTYSLIIALVCGTAGLPHILVRFYTNPDGRAAKRTTLLVMVLIGAFYLFTPIWGTLGRNHIPELLANNKTDAVVIALPKMLENKVLGQVLSGITAAGAFAAFMSTFSGLLVSMSGAFAHDIYGKILKPSATPNERLNAFKVAAIVVGVASMGLGLLVETFDIALLVGWAFAIAAASYFPLLLLGAWWRGLTMPGAAAGMLIGGTASLGAIITFMLIDKKVLTFPVDPLVKGLLEQPAIWGVPLALVLMFVVSAATRSQVPTDIDLKMLRLHAPEELGHSRNYIDEGIAH